MKDTAALMQHEAESSLPEPDAQSAAHSDRVRAHITACIDRAGGAISFAEYMHQALYAPALGYYCVGTTKFGKSGDFVTAPEVSSIFGGVLARQCAPVLQELESGSILELGAGTGKLARDLLDRLGELNALPDQYLILEVSPELQARQKALLRTEVPALADRVAWISRLPRNFRGVVIGNEVVDALPVERFAIRPGGIMQLCVAVDRGEFTTSERPAPGYLASAVEGIERSIGRNFSPGYASEICCALPEWIAALAGAIDEGLVLLFDYGVSRREYYAEDRSDGWLRCHFRHRAHNDPLILTGIQDITSWADFTAIAAAAADAELDVLGYTPQAQFLIAGGLQEELADIAKLGIDAQLGIAREVKLLTLPSEMGEHFKCIGLGRGTVSTPSAFSLADRTAAL